MVGANPLVAEGNFHPLPHSTPKLLSSQCNCNGSWPFFCNHRMVHFSSPLTEGIQSSREACPWHEAYVNSTLKPQQNLQTCFLPKERWKNYVNLQEYCLFIFWKVKLIEDEWFSFLKFHIKVFKCVHFFYKSDLNETLNWSLTDF